ncbi:anti-sigma factor family protein [Nitratireductor soli]|uniref:anti-sigma factor family protein n=1 Tax=Nitratireductor soli TaxID=1670619 RepID=UPI00065DE342|nr:anti-sigma factor [Nitratireductor soli]
MTKTEPGIPRDTLHAYIDGQLSAEAHAAVERHLASHQEDAALVAGWERDGHALRALYGPIGGESVPPALSPHRIARQGHGRPTDWRKLAAAGLVLVAVGAAAGWYGRDFTEAGQASTATLLDKAVAAHNLYVGEVVHPVEVAGAQDGHLARWLSKRLDRTIAIPDLKPAGFSLVGGRLLPDGRGPAAQFMYEDHQGRRVTLYIKPTLESGESSFRFANTGPVAALFWRDEGISCALVGELPRDELQAIATQAYEQLG